MSEHDVMDYKNKIETEFHNKLPAAVLMRFPLEGANHEQNISRFNLS